MNISDDDSQSGGTPPITNEFLSRSLSQITSTLNDLAKWKGQMTSQVIKKFLF